MTGNRTPLAALGGGRGGRSGFRVAAARVRARARARLSLRGVVLALVRLVRVRRHDELGRLRGDVRKRRRQRPDEVALAEPPRRPRVALDHATQRVRGDATRRRRVLAERRERERRDAVERLGRVEDANARVAARVGARLSDDSETKHARRRVVPGVRKGGVFIDGGFIGRRGVGFPFRRPSRLFRRLFEPSPSSRVRVAARLGVQPKRRREEVRTTSDDFGRFRSFGRRFGFGVGAVLEVLGRRSLAPRAEHRRSVRGRLEQKRREPSGFRADARARRGGVSSLPGFERREPIDEPPRAVRERLVLPGAHQRDPGRRARGRDGDGGERPEGGFEDGVGRVASARVEVREDGSDAEQRGSDVAADRAGGAEEVREGAEGGEGHRRVLRAEHRDPPRALQGLRRRIGGGRRRRGGGVFLVVGGVVRGGIGVVRGGGRGRVAQEREDGVQDVVLDELRGDLGGVARDEVQRAELAQGVRDERVRVGVEVRARVRRRGDDVSQTLRDARPVHLGRRVRVRVGRRVGRGGRGRGLVLGVARHEPTPRRGVALRHRAAPRRGRERGRECRESRNLTVR